MAISDIKAKIVNFQVDLVNGERVTIVLRPVNLADKAWWEKLTEEDMKGLQNLAVEPLCKVVWHQMDVESKKLFSDIVFKDVNDDGEEITIKLHGHEKLLHSLKSVTDVLNGYAKFIEVLEANDFVSTGSKKKPTKQTAETTGSKFMTFLRRLMGIR